MLFPALRQDVDPNHAILDQRVELARHSSDVDDRQILDQRAELARHRGDASSGRASSTVGARAETRRTGR